MPVEPRHGIGRHRTESLSMNSSSPASVSVISAAQPPWWDDLQTRLLANEKPLAWLTIDLDWQLKFSAGALVLTNQRLLSWTPTGADAGWSA